MWIFLGVAALLAAVITAILLLPVGIIVKTDQNGELIFRYKLLFKTFGEKSDPDSSFSKTLKKAIGISRFEKQNLQSKVQKTGLANTVSQTGRVLVDLLKEIAGILKHCTAKRLRIRIVCAEEQAADTALSYGRCCAAVYPIAGVIGSVMKVREKGRSIDISCDYVSGQSVFEVDCLISVRILRVLAAFLRVAFKEAKRTIGEQSGERSSRAPQTGKAKNKNGQEP